jgi:hypothetical protein
VKDARPPEGAISLEFLLKPIMTEATTAGECRTVRIDPEMNLRLCDSLCEHRPRGEREERQSYDHCFHFQSPLFV